MTIDRAVALYYHLMPDPLGTWEEVRRLIEAPRSVKHRALLSMTYGSGLRVSEVVRVRIRDVDRGRMMLFIAGGKGHKDRYTVLSRRGLSLLEDLWRWQHPADFFFAGQDRTQPICAGTAQAVYYSALRQSGVRRVGGIHVLRHCFATHLMATLANADWIVYPKPAPDDPSLALDYIARYTHKVAIGDSRIKAIKYGHVTYTWRDRSEDNVEKTETIPTALFTRRFIAHILPDGFHKIRYFGWMSAGNRKAILAAIRQSLHAEPPPPPVKESLVERIRRRTGVDITLCPHCGIGHLRKTGRQILPHRGQTP